MAKKKNEQKIDINAFNWVDADTSPVEKVVVEDKKALKSFFEEDETKAKDLKKTEKTKKNIKT